MYNKRFQLYVDLLWYARQKTEQVFCPVIGLNKYVKSSKKNIMHFIKNVFYLYYLKLWTEEFLRNIYLRNLISIY